MSCDKLLVKQIAHTMLRRVDILSIVNLSGEFIPQKSPLTMLIFFYCTFLLQEPRLFDSWNLILFIRALDCETEVDR